MNYCVVLAESAHALRELARLYSDENAGLGLVLRLLARKLERLADALD